jgi:catalase
VLAGAPDPATGKPNPAKMQAFFAAHPESAAFRQWAASYKPSDSFASTQYHSINAFRLIDSAGTAHPVRWQLEPQTAFAALPGQVDDKQFLQHDLQQRLAQAPLRWTLRLVLAEPGDAVDDPARLWPAERRSDAGTLVLEHVDAQSKGPAATQLRPADSAARYRSVRRPILAARSAAYSESFNRRSRESLSTGARP